MASEVISCSSRYTCLSFIRRRSPDGHSLHESLSITSARTISPAKKVFAFIHFLFRFALDMGNLLSFARPVYPITIDDVFVSFLMKQMQTGTKANCAFCAITRGKRGADFLFSYGTFHDSQGIEHLLQQTRVGKSARNAHRTWFSNPEFDLHVDEAAVDGRPRFLEDLKHGARRSPDHLDLVTSQRHCSGLQFSRFQLLVRPLRVVVLVVLQTKCG